MMELPTSLVGSIVTRGSIIHSNNIHGIDHGKFFVVVGISADSLVGFFFINSGINKYLHDKPSQLALQYPLKCSDYDFLSHDSYIGGASLVKYDRNTLTEQLESRVATLVGTLLDSDLENLLGLCRESRIYSIRDKKDFFS